jgi:hypothetical protein
MGLGSRALQLALELFANMETGCETQTEALTSSRTANMYELCGVAIGDTP